MVLETITQAPIKISKKKELKERNKQEKSRQISFSDFRGKGTLFFRFIDITIIKKTRMTTSIKAKH